MIEFFTKILLSVILIIKEEEKISEIITGAFLTFPEDQIPTIFKFFILTHIHGHLTNKYNIITHNDVLGKAYCIIGEWVVTKLFVNTSKAS